MVRDFKLSLMDGETAIPGTNYTSLFTRPLDPAVIRWAKRQERGLSIIAAPCGGGSNNGEVEHEVWLALKELNSQSRASRNA